MKRLRQILRTILVLPVTALFLLFGFLPLQNAHAQSTTVSHETSRTNSSCSSPCANTPVVLKEQKLIDEKQDDEPEPPEPAPYYMQSDAGFASPKKLANGHLAGVRVLRPPDLVKLYANFRF